MILHVCDTCDTEIDGDCCAEHPDATISSVLVPAEQGYTLCCDRCGDTAAGEPEELIDEGYLVDDPYQATGNLCPTCAQDDDPAHIQGSWLLSWDEI